MTERPEFNIDDIDIPDGIDIRQFGDEYLFRPATETEGWWTWDEMKTIVTDAHRALVAGGYIEQEPGVPPTNPKGQRFSTWCGYIIGAIFTACVIAIMLAATIATIRALL